MSSSKIRILFSLFLGLLATKAHAQGLVDKSADGGLMVRQIPNSESALIDYFSKLKAEPSDTIYATIFRPANCPRCDGFLNKINSLVKSHTNKPSVLIAVFPDSMASENYINRYDLKSDYMIYDTNEDFSKFLSFSPGYLHVGYILKINKKTGQLIIGSNADNVSSRFFEELNHYSKVKEQREFPSSSNKSYFEWVKENTQKLKIKHHYPFANDSTRFDFSEIIYQPVFFDDHLLVNDKLTMAVAELNLSDGRIVCNRIIEPDSLESAAFVSASEDVYLRMLNSGQLKNIPLQPFIISKDKYAVAYSLPELWTDDENCINYRNKPCFLEKSFSDSTYSKLVPLNYDFEDVFYYPHFNMKWLGSNKVVVGVQRITWPIISDRREYEGIPEMDPFKELFYDAYPQPTLASFDVDSGLLDQRFGSLPDLAKLTKTGYTFSDMVMDSWDDEVVFAESYGGNIFLADVESMDCLDCTKKFKAFEIPLSVFQVPDSSTYYSYDCSALAEPVLNRKIMDIKADASNIHCLIRHCTDAFECPEREAYDYVIMDRESGERYIFDFPELEENERRIGYGLRRISNGAVTPYIIRSFNGKWEVIELEQD